MGRGDDKSPRSSAHVSPTSPTHNSTLVSSHFQTHFVNTPYLTIKMFGLTTTQAVFATSVFAVLSTTAPASNAFLKKTTYNANVR